MAPVDPVTRTVTVVVKCDDSGEDGIQDRSHKLVAVCDVLAEHQRHALAFDSPAVYMFLCRWISEALRHGWSFMICRCRLPRSMLDSSFCVSIWAAMGVQGNRWQPRRSFV